MQPIKKKRSFYCTAKNAVKVSLLTMRTGFLLQRLSGIVMTAAHHIRVFPSICPIRLQMQATPFYYGKYTDLPPDCQGAIPTFFSLPDTGSGQPEEELPLCWESP